MSSSTRKNPPQNKKNLGKPNNPTFSEERKSSPKPPRNNPIAKPSVSSLSFLQDRMLYLIIHLVGKRVEVQVKDGSWFEGILHTVEHNNKSLGIALKWARKKQAPNSNKKEVHTTPPIENLLITPSDFIQLNAVDVSLDSKFDKNEFSTDSEISGKVLKEKELVPWAPDSSIDDGITHGIDFNEQTNLGWDQFRVNQQLFGVKSTYDEELYTTKLTKDATYKSRLAEASRLAQEIENAPRRPISVHQLEEWNQAADIDEEELYGAVKRPEKQPEQPASSSSSAGAPKQTQPSKAALPPKKTEDPNKPVSEQRRSQLSELKSFSSSIASKVKETTEREKIRREKMKQDLNEKNKGTEATTPPLRDSSEIGEAAAPAAEQTPEKTTSELKPHMNPNAPTFKPLNAEAQAFVPSKPYPVEPPPMPDQSQYYMYMPPQEGDESGGYPMMPPMYPMPYQVVYGRPPPPFMMPFPMGYPHMGYPPRGMPYAPTGKRGGRGGANATHHPPPHSPTAAPTDQPTTIPQQPEENKN